MPKRSLHIKLVSFIVVIILLSANSLRADVTGSIQGVVKDRSEASVASAKVVVINVETNLTHDTVSGADGSFRFLGCLSAPTSLPSPRPDSSHSS